MNNMMNRAAAFAVCKSFAAKKKVKETFADLMSDERGVSGTVVAILLILVAVLAVAMIWKFLSKYLQGVAENIEKADDVITAAPDIG